MTATPSYDSSGPLQVHGPGAGDWYRTTAGAILDDPDFTDIVRAVGLDIRFHAALMVVIGDVDIARNLLIHQVIRDLPRSVAPVLLKDPLVNFEEVTQLVGVQCIPGQIETDLEAPSGEGESRSLLRQFLYEQHQKGRSVALFVDEAHLMSKKLLNDLLLFSHVQARSNRLLQIILVGIPDLAQVFSAPQLRELGRERKVYRLPPQSRQDANAFTEQPLGEVQVYNSAYPRPDELFEKLTRRPRGIRRLAHFLRAIVRFSPKRQRNRIDSKKRVGELGVDAPRETIAADTSPAGTEARRPLPLADRQDTVFGGNDSFEQPPVRPSGITPSQDSAKPDRQVEQQDAESGENDSFQQPTVRPSNASPDNTEAPRHLPLDDQQDAESGGNAFNPQPPVLPTHTAPPKKSPKPDSPKERPCMSRLDSLNKILKQLQTESPGIEASALISEDGLMIASSLPEDLDEIRVAGMTATLLNLGARAATELRRGDVQEVIVRGEQGYAVTIGAGRGTVLLVLTTEHTKLGLIFFDMREAIKAVRNVL